MKKLFLLLSLFIISQLVVAKTIDQQTAQEVAVTFYSARVAPQNADAVSAVLAHQEVVTMLNNQATESPTVLYYIFNINTEGWVIVSGDDHLEPIIAYSKEGNFPVGEIMPEHVSRWFQNYKNEIRYVLENEIPASEAISEKWNQLETGELEIFTESSAVVDPLLSVKWNQIPYVNADCPGGSVTGCLATAMAQIMKYHNHPIHGTGDYHYEENDYGTLTANFGATTYDWANMPDIVNAPNSAVAKLMYHCGVSVNMNYSPQSSGASPSYVVPALTKYFDYDASAVLERRSNYTDTQWTTKVKGELDASRPIQYCGFGNGSGHAFVCDGYDANDMFHFNWGWGGVYDGFFGLNGLNPSGVGTGGGSGGYNANQLAVMGIQPASDQVSSPLISIQLDSEITVTPDPVDLTGNITVNANVKNVGALPFIGDIEAVIYDGNMKLVEVIGVHNETNGLAPGANYPGGLTFTNNVQVTPGNYFVGILDRFNNGEWVIAGNTDDFQNLIPIQILHENTNGIEVNAEIPEPAQPLVQNGPAEFTVSYINKSSSNRSGSISMDVLTTDGQYIAELGIETVSLCAGCTTELTFSVASLNLAPGTYSFGTYELTGSNWQVVGSTEYDNPILLSVAAPGIAPDQYEDNNDEASSYELALDFGTGNTATLSTPGSNAHQGEDYDFYKITLPAGYNYTLSPRLHDSFDSGNGETYTYDGILSYNVDGTWSDAHDDVISPLLVAGGNTAYFHTAPHFSGYTGTYLFEVVIERTPSTSVDDVEDNAKIVIAPNPASDKINILTDDIQVESTTVFDCLGKLIARQSQSLEVNISALPEGMYFLMIETNEGFVRKQFVKTNQ